MSISILSNVQSLRAGNELNALQKLVEESAARLSSGKNILSAKDDPAGIGILSNLQSQAVSFNAVAKNISSGVAIIETASGALETQQEILTQMKDLATQAASDILTADQRDSLQKTFVELQSQLDQTAGSAKLFGQDLISSAAADVNIQSGINAGDTFTISSAKSDAVTLGLDAATVDLTDATKASAAMTAIDTAVATVATNQSILGAQQNGLDALSRNSERVHENIMDAIGRIQDVDVAKETSNLALLQSRLQFTTSMMGLINSFPQNALSLLR